jgi:hypothetical protein
MAQYKRKSGTVPRSPELSALDFPSGRAYFYPALKSVPRNPAGFWDYLKEIQHGKELPV